MSYYFNESDKAIYEHHTRTTPLRVSGNVEETISYLDQLYKMDIEKISLLDRLLQASLTGIALGKIQDEAAKMLRYPGIDGYIKEKFKKNDLVGYNG